uniref:EipB family protein n=1 Tax=Proteus mirabilis TaxID=584 RepID=UPI0013D87E65
VYDTLAVIGRQVTAPATGERDKPLKEGALAGMPHWPVRLSYFTQGEGERTPIYLSLFYSGAVFLFAAALWTLGGSVLAYCGLAAFALHLAWQVARIDIADPALCLRLFQSNRDAGLI